VGVLYAYVRLANVRSLVVLGKVSILVRHRVGKIYATSLVSSAATRPHRSTAFTNRRSATFVVRPFGNSVPSRREWTPSAVALPYFRERF
jgi:hypothetical protein